MSRLKYYNPNTNQWEYLPIDADTDGVTSVNGKKGNVVISASDVGADPAGSAATAESNANDYTDSSITTIDYPVDSVNSRTGAVTGLAENNAVVHLTGDETVSGVKTFSASPIVPTPTTNTQAANKVYVDNAISAIPGDAVTSVFGRTGAVVSALGDYLASQITNVPTGNISSTTVQAALNELDSEKAIDANVVHLTGNETIVDTKTFSSSPIVPTPTIDTQSANKLYVDTAVAAVPLGNYVLKDGDTMSGALLNTSYIMASGSYPSAPTVPGVYLGIPSTLNPRFTIVSTSGSVRAIDNNGGQLRFINSTAGTVQMVGDGNGLFQFGSNQTPQQTITVGSVGTGYGHYNTVDQSTNWERARMFWSTNVYTIATESGGTGTVRAMRLASGTRRLEFLDGGASTNTFSFYSTATMGLQPMLTVADAGAGGSYVNSSGITNVMRIIPTFAQSGTAGYTALLVNSTETSTGSGTRLLADFQTGGVSRLSINFAGSLVTSGFVQAGQLVPSSSSVPTRGIYLPVADTLGFSTASTIRMSINATGQITIAEAGDIVLGTTTGTKIGTSTTQKIGLWNKTPIVQPTTAIAGATRVGGGGTTVTDTDTFGGYTIAKIAQALINLGVLA